jgi:DivIVA domain-containing protein
LGWKPAAVYWLAAARARVNLTFPRTKLRRGYDQQEVDQFLSLIAANLALPLAERTLRPEEVTTAYFKSTHFRPDPTF